MEDIFKLESSIVSDVSKLHSLLETKDIYEVINLSFSIKHQLDRLLLQLNDQCTSEENE
jgi:hypothetical protein